MCRLRNYFAEFYAFSENFLSHLIHYHPLALLFPMSEGDNFMLRRYALSAKGIMKILG